MRIINKPKEVVFWVHPRRSGKAQLRKKIEAVTLRDRVLAEVDEAFREHIHKLFHEAFFPKEDLSTVEAIAAKYIKEN